MGGAIPFDGVLSLKEVGLHLAFGPPELVATRGEADVEPVESALRLADSWTRPRRGRRSPPTLLYSLTVSSEALEQRAAALGISREIHGPSLHLLGPSIDPEELLAGLGEWVCAWGLKLLLVDASQADPAELEALVPLLRSLSTEWLVYTVLFLPARSGFQRDQSGEATDARA